MVCAFKGWIEAKYEDQTTHKQHNQAEEEEGRSSEFWSTENWVASGSCCKMLVDERQPEDLLKSRIDRKSSKIDSKFKIKEAGEKNESGAKSRDVISSSVIEA